MSGFVRKFGKTKTFSNLVVQLLKIFFQIVLLQTHTSVNKLLYVHDKQAGIFCASFILLLYWINNDNRTTVVIPAHI